MSIKTYIINLKESTERRAYIQNAVACHSFMNVEMVDAVNGRNLSKEEQERLFDGIHFGERYHGRMVLPGEIGCTLSHRICYEKFLASDEEVALILEDDVMFYQPEKLEEYCMATAELLRLGKADMVISVPLCLYYKNKEKKIGNYSFYPVHRAFSTCAYLINRAGAEKILKKDAKPSVVADDYFGYRRMGLKVYAGTPLMTKGLSDHGDLTSIIGYKASYGKTPCTIRAVKYRIMARCSRAWIFSGVLFKFIQNMELRYSARYASISFVHKATGY